MNTEKIMEDIQTVQDNIREIKSTWGNTIMTLDNIKSGLKADVQKKVDEAYQRGLNDAWEAARKIFGDVDSGGLTLNVLNEVFGTKGYSFILRENTAQDAIAKLKAYEDKRSDRIEVGDEVIDKDGDTTIVTNIHERLFDGLCGDGSTMSDLFLEDVRKTGRHYDHISKLLEAIRA